MTSTSFAIRPIGPIRPIALPKQNPLHPVNHVKKMKYQLRTFRFFRGQNKSHS